MSKHEWLSSLEHKRRYFEKVIDFMDKNSQNIFQKFFSLWSSEESQKIILKY